MISSVLLRPLTVTISLLAWIIASGASAQPTPEDLRLLEPDALERPWVGYRSAQCPSQTNGPGDSPRNPITIEEFYDLRHSAWAWETPERGRQLNQWELEDGQALTLDLHCKWVRVTGYFRRDGYQQYRGVLASSSQSLYTNGGPENKIREGLYFIENWSDSKTRSALINGADIRIVAQFYDLCRIAYREREEAQDGRIIMSGPCHYGRFTGLMLRQAEVEAVLSEPFQRVRGEYNRSVVGDIREVSPSWPEFAVVKRAAIDKIDIIRAGSLHYWTQMLSRWGQEENIQERASDPDNWISFLAHDERSPLKGRRRIENNQFKIFRLLRYGGGETEEQINIAIACFCTRRTCGDVWPLFQEDATDFHSDYLCFSLHRDHNDKKKWQ